MRALGSIWRAGLVCRELRIVYAPLAAGDRSILKRLGLNEADSYATIIAGDIDIESFKKEKLSLSISQGYKVTLK